MMTTKTTTVIDCIVQRIADEGVQHCFGVPGDYAFPVGDAVDRNPNIKWIGCSNELNASYRRKRRRIYFGLAPVRFGCCGCAAHLVTVETKTPRLSATVASEAHLAIFVLENSNRGLRGSEGICVSSAVSALSAVQQFFTFF